MPKLCPTQRLPGRNNWTTDPLKAHVFITGYATARAVAATERDVRREQGEPPAAVIAPLEVHGGYLARVRVGDEELYCE